MLSFEHHVRLNEAALAMENIVDHLTSFLSKETLNGKTRVLWQSIPIVVHWVCFYFLILTVLWLLPTDDYPKVHLFVQIRRIM